MDWSIVFFNGKVFRVNKTQKLFLSNFLLRKFYEYIYEIFRNQSLFGVWELQGENILEPTIYLLNVKQANFSLYLLGSQKSEYFIKTNIYTYSPTLPSLFLLVNGFTSLYLPALYSSRLFN